MSALVSVIIPCFNAERWVGEAIESALGQTYSPIEVTVIDDGSTDSSLKIIQRLGDKIRWETGPNRGGNAARNRGFALSKGQYIQFLDADDYLLPDKIKRQVEVLSNTFADVVYEDWQRLDQRSNGTTILHSPEISGAQDDVLEALLASWAPPPCALLFKRSVVEAVGGWNERLGCAQDWELNMRLALASAVYRYLPGCYSLYRRPSMPTVSTKNAEEMHQTIIAVLKRAEATLRASGRLNRSYRRAIASSYFRLARCFYEKDRTRFEQLLGEAQRLSTSFASKQPFVYRTVASTFGVNVAERLAAYKRRLTGSHSSAATD